jgi:murein DD-endopeptidase MepM/ murein hydrolase activator NlpD
MAAKLFDTDNVTIGGDPAAHRSRPKYKAGDWYSGKGYDLHVKPSTEVYSLTDGKVVANNWEPDNCKEGVYGNRVTIFTDNNDELYYTHIESKLKVGKNIKKGDLIGKVRKGCGVEPHLHVASKNKDVKDYVDFKTWAIIGGGGGTTDPSNDPENEDNGRGNIFDPGRGNVIAAMMDDNLGGWYANFAVGSGLLGLAKEGSKNQKLIEQIRRIQKLL